MNPEVEKDDYFNPFVDDPLLTVKEAAAYCRVSVTTINTWRREKRIPCVKTTNDARFRRSDLNRFINGHLTWGLQAVLP
jgi:excisionase family DNA binding protein